MKFLKNKNILYHYLFCNKMIKARGVAFFAILFCCYTVDAQLITTPTLQQHGTLQQVGTLTSTPTLQTGTLNNSDTDSSFYEEGGPCGIEQAIRERTQNDPNFAESSRKGLQKLVSEVDSIIDHRNRFPNRIANVIIPVVFHYFYDECAPGHPTYELGPPPEVYGYERFENAVRILNEDFNPQGLNKISFRLAELDPVGNPTNGINYIKDGLTYDGAGGDTRLREFIQWPRNTYLNVYVVEEATPQTNSGIAFFPEQSDGTSIKYDGVTVARWAFDPTYEDGNHSQYCTYVDTKQTSWTSDDEIKETNCASVTCTDENGNLVLIENCSGIEASNGQAEATVEGYPYVADVDNYKDHYRTTLSHEVGHWLGLRHIWGNELTTTNTDYCLIDDFDFYNGTDNQIKYDTPKCNKPGSDWRICNHDDGCGVYADDYNIMDYSGCRESFTSGQIKYMESVMSASVSDRDKISGNNLSAFHKTYSNYNQAITTPSVVFTNGSIAYESKLNDGTISNSFIIELRGGLQFSSSVLANGALQADEYSFPVPVGFTTMVNITSSTTAELVINHISGNHSLDQDAIMEINNIDNSNNLIFNANVGDPMMRSKLIKFDFLDDIEYKYYDDISVGPQSLLFKKINVLAPQVIGTAFIGYYNGMYGFGKHDDANIEFVVDSDGFIITLSDNDMIQYQDNFDAGMTLSNTDASYLFSVGPNLSFRKINIPEDEIFYVPVKINYCVGIVDDMNNPINGAYVGWLRLKKDTSCDRLIVLDSGINSNGISITPGQQSRPSILYNSSTITKVETVGGSVFKGFNIELKPADTSLEFANEAQISTNYSISAISYAPYNMLNPNDFVITRLDNYNLLVEPKLANNTFWANQTSYFTFKMEFGNNAFYDPNNVFNNSEFNGHLFKSTIVEVKRPNYDYQGNTFTSGNLYETLVTQTGAKIQIGTNRFFIRYGGSPPNGGYGLGSISDHDKVEIACLPNSNQIQLFDLGQSSENLNFEPVNEGILTPSPGSLLEPHNLFIPDNKISTVWGQTKYIIYRRIENCETYYNWLKISFDTYNYLTNLGWGGSYIDEETVFAGIIYDNEIDHINNAESNTGCIASISDTRDFIHINKVIFEYFQPQQTEFSSPIAVEPDRYSDFTGTPVYDFDLSEKYVYSMKIDFGGDPFLNGVTNDTYTSIWIDFNKNDYFEADEHIFQQQNFSTNEYIVFNLCFPTDRDLFGQYKMRVMTNIIQLSGSGLFSGCNGNIINPTYGCREIVGGEIEDYTITVTSDCNPPVNYNEFSIPSENILAESITISSNIMPHTRSTMAGASICLLPSSEVHYGSVYLAEAIVCGSQNLKQTQAQLPTSTIKIYPNPFSQQSTVEFELNNDTEVSIFVSDITGKKLATLASNEQKAAGIHQVNFNAKGIAPGIYYCTMIAGDKIETQKMVITK